MEFDATHGDLFAAFGFMLRTYPEGSRFTVPSDHDGIIWMLNVTDATGKPARKRLRLPGVKLNVAHPGDIRPQHTDAIS